MKKSLLVAVAVLLLTSMKAFAGHFTDLLPPAQTAGCVPTANGYDWNCSGDQYSPPMSANGAVLTPYTKAQIAALTQGTTGQVVVCSDCTQSYLCVSTGTLSVHPDSFVVAVETATIVGGPKTKCR